VTRQTGNSRAIDAPTPWRNRQPILDVLERVLPPRGAILEIASGTGQHAAFLAPRVGPLTWQPSDPDSTMFDSIAAWAAVAETEFDAGAAPLPPVRLDVTDDPWPIARADGIVCINMIHIAPPAATTGLLAGAERILPPNGFLFLYGPFMRGGAHTAPSNQAFDDSLKARDSRWGVRDLDRVAAEAEDLGLNLDQIVDMPANNLSVIFRRAT
jgi:SAM-dependent methyltransferase